ncbi:MAG: helix-turn-helix domain-containing protein [Opitutaceae bacterium]
MATPPLLALFAAARRLPGESYAVDRPLDERSRYRFDLQADFPFAIKRLWFFASQPKPPLTWHSYLEIFVPLSTGCRVRMGGAALQLASGDVLVMDHLKLHALEDIGGAKAEAIVIRFLPEMVRGSGWAGSDHLLLLPFYCQLEEQPHVLRAAEPEAGQVHAAMAALFAHYAESDGSPYGRTGARAWFLVLLHELARRFRAAEVLTERVSARQARDGRLRDVFAHIEEHYAERVSLVEMAAAAGLSRAQFHTVFKKATGTTLLGYLAQVRLTRAARLLQETGASIAEIATATGFADQSYFDRRFRQRFGRSPLHFRRESLGIGAGSRRGRENRP